MQRSCDTFHLIDLVSQAAAVQSLLAGCPPDEKIEWLASHGKLAALPVKPAGSRQVFSFESYVGLQCLFFIDGDDLIFIGDHATWRVPR